VSEFYFKDEQIKARYTLTGNVYFLKKDISYVVVTVSSEFVFFNFYSYDSLGLIYSVHVSVSDDELEDLEMIENLNNFDLLFLLFIMYYKVLQNIISKEKFINEIIVRVKCAKFDKNLLNIYLRFLKKYAKEIYIEIIKKQLLNKSDLKMHKI